MTFTRINGFFSHGFLIVASLAIGMAAFIQMRPALADIAAPGEPCTGQCGFYLPGAGWIYGETCIGPYACCCEWYNIINGVLIWNTKCCNGSNQAVNCGYLPMEDGTWIPVCQTIAGGNPCDGCDDLGIQ